MLMRGPLRSAPLAGDLVAAVPGEVNLIAVAAIGQVGTFTPQPSQVSNGVQGVGQVGGAVTSVFKLVIGVEGTGQVGTETEAVDRGVSGVQATGQVGGAVANPRAVIEGVSATGQVSAPESYTITKTLTGVAGTGQVGTAQSGRLVETLGVSATGVANGQVPRLGPQIEGVSATGIAAGVGQEHLEQLSGVQGVGATGTSVPRVGAVISGVEATGVANVPGDYAQGASISGVQGVGLTGSYISGEEDDVFSNTGTGTDSGSYCYINRGLILPAGATITKLWLYLTSSASGTLYIFRRDSSGNYTAVASVAFTHAGGSQFLDYTLSSPYIVPNDGFDYVIGTYQGGGTQTGLNNNGSWAWRLGSPNGSTSGWSEGTNNNDVASVGYTALVEESGARVYAQVGAHVAGVQAVGHVGGVAAGDLQQATITGVAGTGQVAGVVKTTDKGVTGVQGTALLGSQIPNVRTTITGVAGIGFAGEQARSLARGITGVQGVGATIGTEDVLGSTGTSTEPGGSTYINLDFEIGAGRLVSGLWIWSDTSYSGAVKLVRRNSATSYTPVQSENFTHPGGSQWYFVPLASNYRVPNDGFQYYPAVYSASTIPGTYSGTATRRTGELTAQADSGWTADTEPMSLGVQYLNLPLPVVSVGLQGLQATGQVGTAEGGKFAPITGVQGVGVVATLRGTPAEPLTGLQAVGHVGGMNKRVMIALPGVSAQGYPAAPVISFVIKRRRVLAMTG